MIHFADNCRIYVLSIDPGTHTHTPPNPQGECSEPAFQDSHSLAASTHPKAHTSHQPACSTSCFFRVTRDIPFPFFLAKSHSSLEAPFSCHPPDKVFPDLSGLVSPLLWQNVRWQRSTRLWQILNCYLLTCHVIANSQCIEGGARAFYFCIP